MYDLIEQKIEELKDLVNRIENFDGVWVEIKEGIPHAFYNDLIINFDWGKWEEGRAFFKNTDENKYNSIDREYILKLLTAIARNDRFCEGAWGNLFKSGVALILYKKLYETYI